MSHRKAIAKSRQRGFSLLEFLIVMTIMVIVIGVATDGLIQLQKRNNSDASKLDMTQEARQFMDQVTNDIHQVGYPNTKLFDPAGGTPQTSISAGLTGVTGNTLQFEADVDGSGTVSTVFLDLVSMQTGQQVAPGGTGCPCRLRRGTLPKAQVGTGAIPYFTQVTNVMINTTANPPIPIFDAYDFAGNLIVLPAQASDLPNIKTVRMTINVQQNAAEMDGTHPTITMVTEAKINN